MSRLKYRKQFASSRGIYAARSYDNPSVWDVIDKCGPRGHILTKREAINLAYKISLQISHLKVYTLTDSGWHRGLCEVVAYDKATAKPCRCKYLDMNQAQ